MELLKQHGFIIELLKQHGLIMELLKLHNSITKLLKYILNTDVLKLQGLIMELHDLIVEVLKYVISLSKCSTALPYYGVLCAQLLELMWSMLSFYWSFPYVINEM